MLYVSIIYLIDQLRYQKLISVQKSETLFRKYTQVN